MGQANRLTNRQRTENLGGHIQSLRPIEFSFLHRIDPVHPVGIFIDQNHPLLVVDDLEHLGDIISRRPPDAGGVAEQCLAVERIR